MAITDMGLYLAAIFNPCYPIRYTEYLQTYQLSIAAPPKTQDSRLSCDHMGTRSGEIV